MNTETKRRVVIDSTAAGDLPTLFTAHLDSRAMPAPHIIFPKYRKMLAKNYGGWEYGYWRDFVDHGETIDFPSRFSMFAIPNGTVLYNGLVLNDQYACSLDYFRLPPKNHRAVNQVIEYSTYLNLCWMGWDYHNYLIETIPRLLLCMQQLKARKQRVKILWHYDTTKRFVAQTLKILRFNPKMFINTFQNGSSVAYKGKEILLPFAHPRDPRTIRYNDPVAWYAVPEHLQMTRAAFLNKMKPQKNESGLALYLSRKDVAKKNPKYRLGPSGRGRNVSNETQVLSYLKKRFGSKLVVFCGQDFDIPATIRLFSRASIVIGPHGGALANTLFSKDGTVVVEFLPEERTPQFFYTTSACLNHLYYPLPIKNAEWEGSMRVPMKELGRILDSVPSKS